MINFIPGKMYEFTQARVVCFHTEEPKGARPTEVIEGDRLIFIEEMDNNPDIRRCKFLFGDKIISSNMRLAYLSNGWKLVD